jgi:hypothetical protein
MIDEKAREIIDRARSDCSGHELMAAVRGLAWGTISPTRDSSAESKEDLKAIQSGVGGYESSRTAAAL